MLWQLCVPHQHTVGDLLDLVVVEQPNQGTVLAALCFTKRRHDWLTIFPDFQVMEHAREEYLSV